MHHFRFAAAALAVAASLFLAGPAVAHEAPPSPFPMDFTPPAPGSYTLQRIMRAPDGKVLDTDGSAYRLSRFTQGRITVLSFMYTRCTDPGGCPLAYLALQEVGRLLEGTPALQDRVRLVSLSFDPAHDTPEQMKLYSRRIKPGPVEWRFLTPASRNDLLPLLDGFGQDVAPAGDDAGQADGQWSHVLRVFLIDETGMVREIYSTSFLLPPVVVNDIKTLLMERGAGAR